VDWPVERASFDLPGQLPDDRVLLHWACVEDDHIERDFSVEEALAFADFVVAQERTRGI
jgi:hypothetical protein